MSNSDSRSGDDTPGKPHDPISTQAADDIDSSADELRAMLRKLGDQIAATDRRNSETLAEMQVRLSEIGARPGAHHSSSLR